MSHTRIIYKTKDLLILFSNNNSRLKPLSLIRNCQLEPCLTSIWDRILAKEDLTPARICLAVMRETCLGSLIVALSKTNLCLYRLCLSFILRLQRIKASRIFFKKNSRDKLSRQYKLRGQTKIAQYHYYRVISRSNTCRTWPRRQSWEGKSLRNIRTSFTFHLRVKRERPNLKSGWKKRSRSFRAREAVHTTTTIWATLFLRSKWTRTWLREK